MSHDWNVAVYRARAKAWREEAEGLPPGKPRDTCMAIANGYADLVRWIELDEATSKCPVAYRTGT